MEIDRLVLGLYETNCYILRADKASSECVVIDAGLDKKGIVEYLSAKKLEPVALVLTHAHVDHIGGAAAVKDRYPGVRIYIHQADAPRLGNPQDNLSSFSGVSIDPPLPDVRVKDGDTIEEAQIALVVLHTPGHTPGGISLYCPQASTVFSGDALFAESVGRTDFPGGDMAQLSESIKNKLFVLPDQTTVYPGHGPATTIAHEKNHNPFLK
jgi:hydroxyacylglutathione hydrolase